MTAWPLPPSAADLVAGLKLLHLLLRRFGLTVLSDATLEPDKNGNLSGKPWIRFQTSSEFAAAPPLSKVVYVGPAAGLQRGDGGPERAQEPPQPRPD